MRLSFWIHRSRSLERRNWQIWTPRSNSSYLVVEWLGHRILPSMPPRVWEVPGSDPSTRSIGRYLKGWGPLIRVWRSSRTLGSEAAWECLTPKCNTVRTTVRLYKMCPWKWVHHKQYILNFETTCKSSGPENNKKLNLSCWDVFSIFSPFHESEC